MLLITCSLHHLGSPTPINACPRRTLTRLFPGTTALATMQTAHLAVRLACSTLTDIGTINWDVELHKLRVKFVRQSIDSRVFAKQGWLLKENINKHDVYFYILSNFALSTTKVLARLKTMDADAALAARHSVIIDLEHLKVDMNSMLEKAHRKYGKPYIVKQMLVYP